MENIQEERESLKREEREAIKGIVIVTVLQALGILYLIWVNS
ncbi:MAG: hypothetical protein ABI091_16960 [Ferruginibacter sp.]